MQADDGIRDLTVTGVQTCALPIYVIISGGENISSVEVESLLLRHPAVEEVAIVGFADKRWGEAPHAFVVLKQGAHVDEAELREFARANLAHFKVPQRVTFLNELPKT